MERKYLAVAGFVLIGLIFVAGIVFSPSGFVSAEPGATLGVGCVELGSSADFCGEDGSYWDGSTFSSKDLCIDARDSSAKSCEINGCTCRTLK